MLLMAFGWLLIQSQVAVASHDCDLNVQGASIIAQHAHMTAQPVPTQAHAMSAPLCDKHCVPDAAQKESGHSPQVAIPAALTLAVNLPDCETFTPTLWSLTPPAAGPPTTIRFCRFRE